MASLLLLACSGRSDDRAAVQIAPPGSAATASASATAPPQSATPSSPVVAGEGTVTDAAAAGSVSLPPLLPRIGGVVESATEATDGSVAVTWLVEAPPGEVVAALAGAVASSLTVLLDERGVGGGLIVFEGASLAGHYLVTAADGDARVELRLDAPPSPPATPALAQPLPAGYPAAEVLVFPGATVVSGSSEALTAATTRFVVTLETERPGLYLVGFYRDLFAAMGWETVVRELELTASGPAGAFSLTVTEASPARAVLLLDWTASRQ